MISRKKNIYNNQIVNLFKNFFFVITSNLVSTLISIIVILFIPKFIGVEQYGYLQLYVLYTSFIGLLHFGWNDGLYLRFGGREYNSLDRSTFFSQFYLLLFFQVSLAIVGTITISHTAFSQEKVYTIYMTLISMVLVNVRYMLLFLLQATYRIKEYSIITIFDRLLYLFLIIGLILSKVVSYKYLIFADLIGKLASLLLAVSYCSDIVLQHPAKFKIYNAVNEAIENIRVGIKLMLSNIANKLVIGNVRLGIETVWNIAVFGKISLILSITSFVLIFINAISLVLFPFLRRVKKILLRTLYEPIRETLTLLLLLFLLTYYPLRFLLDIWLPAYSDAFKYLLILYPMVIFEGKMSLLINTYLKVLREESLLLKINFLVFLMSLLCTLITVFIIKSIDLAVYTILALSFIKVSISEYYIQKLLDIDLRSSICKEFILVVSFIAVNTFLSQSYAIILYVLSLIAYLITSIDKPKLLIKLIIKQTKSPPENNIT